MIGGKSSPFTPDISASIEALHEAFYRIHTLEDGLGVLPQWNLS